MAAKVKNEAAEALKQLTYLASALKAPRITEAAARLADHARDAGLVRLLLETGTEQPEAIALYESAGWTPVPAFGHYASDPRTRGYELAL